ncbi:hypothetical protein T08_4754, partial [Trichinella sp. T8]
LSEEGGFLAIDCLPRCWSTHNPSKDGLNRYRIISASYYLYSRLDQALLFSRLDQALGMMESYPCKTKASVWQRGRRRDSTELYATNICDSHVETIHAFHRHSNIVPDE